jgi:tetratricopeptide (TPR) repeat protein
VARERTGDVQSITELRLPEDVVDQPFYLIRFAAGYSYYNQNNYREALPHFKAALRRKGALPDELADLQFFTAVCDYSLSLGQTNMTVNLQEAIRLYETAMEVYAQPNKEKWAMTQNNLGLAYWSLPAGDRAANLQKAIAAYEAALRVRTEKDFPTDWAMTQNNLGLLYAGIAGASRRENLEKAKVCFEAALRIYMESTFPEEHHGTTASLGNVEKELREATAR